MTFLCMHENYSDICAYPDSSLFVAKEFNCVTIKLAVLNPAC